RRRRHRSRQLLADLERVDVDRLGDVLQSGCAKVGDLEIEPRLHLPVGLLGEADRTGLGDALEPRRNVDAVAHEVAVALLDDVAQVNADTVFDAPLGRHAGVALDEAGLHFDGAAHGVDHAAELYDRAVAGALDDPAAMRGDRRLEEIAAQTPDARQRALLVGAGEAAEADNIRDQDRRELSGLGHGAASSRPTLPQTPGTGRAGRPSRDAQGRTWRRNRAPERARLLQPAANCVLDVTGRFLTGVAVRHAAWKIGDGRDEASAFLFGQRLDHDSAVRFCHLRPSPRRSRELANIYAIAPSEDQQAARALRPRRPGRAGAGASAGGAAPAPRGPAQDRAPAGRPSRVRAER